MKDKYCIIKDANTKSEFVSILVLADKNKTEDFIWSYNPEHMKVFHHFNQAKMGIENFKQRGIKGNPRIITVKDCHHIFRVYKNYGKRIVTGKV